MLQDLTVVIPAHNEAGRLPATLRRIDAYLAARPEPHEIVVVDDGSADGTADAARALELDAVRVVVRDARGGKGAAVRTGVESASFGWVLVVDADGSIPIDQLERLERETAAHPIVIGSKWAPGAEASYPWKRRLLSAVARGLVGLFVVGGFRDTQCGFKLFRAAVARDLFAHQRLTGYGYDFEVLFLARRFGHAVAEVPIRCEHRAGGKVQLASYWRTLLELGTVAWGRALGRYPRAAEGADQSSRQARRVSS